MSRSSFAATAVIAILLAGAAIGAQEQAPPRFGERVEVGRLIVDARVLDDRGSLFPDHELFGAQPLDDRKCERRRARGRRAPGPRP